MRAAVIPSFPLQFQCEYVQLRASLLEGHCQLIHTCNTFRTCPPPAIASALAIANGQEITRCGQIVSQLTKCSKGYEDLSEKFADLYQMSFDADANSLHNVLQLQMSCELMKLAINSITLASQEGQGLLADKMMLGVGESSSSDLFHTRLLAIHKELGDLLQKVGTHKITYMHMEFLTQAACRLTPSLISFPRYFFQSLQQTSVKLAISPQQQSALEPVLVQSDTHLTLKVEGVIQHGSQPGLFRKIHSISISVDSAVVTKAQTSDQKVTESCVNNLTQAVEPHNDYFSVSFILGFPIAGAHLVNIHAAIIDEKGCLWKTGPKVSLQVKSYDDALQRQQAKMPSRPSYSQLFTS